MSQDAPPSRGLVAGKYELLRMIGRGGMGSVWEGRHTSLGTHVAIKFIETQGADNEDAHSRFDNEARAAAAIQSKHAIQIHDHGVTEDGKPYIVMEMLVGESLGQRLERVKILSLHDTVFMLLQVCRGLQKAHESGIVHRDIKPENIFLVKSSDDDEEIAKVLDFGIAKIRAGATAQNISNNTRTGVMLGTPFYMSPEQARGLRDIDHRTDLWSLGIIAFECTTGRLPFEGESLGDLLVKICTVSIPMPSQINPRLPPSFDAWFSRALERDPSRRFASASELAQALAYAAGVSFKARSTIDAAVQPPPQMPGPSPQGTGTVVGAYAAYGAPIRPITPVTSSLPANSARGGKTLLIFAALMALVGGVLGIWGAKALLNHDAAAAPSAVATTRYVEPPPVTLTPVATALIDDRAEVMSILDQLETELKACEAEKMHQVNNHADKIVKLTAQLERPIASFGNASAGYAQLKLNAPKFVEACQKGDDADSHHHHHELTEAVKKMRDGL